MVSQINQSNYPINPGHKENTTSKEAAEFMKPKTKTIRSKILNVLKNKGNYGATPDEVSSLLTIYFTSVRPRFSELKKMGCIEKTKRRRKNESGTDAWVWRYIKDE